MNLYLDDNSAKAVLVALLRRTEGCAARRSELAGISLTRVGDARIIGANLPTCELVISLGSLMLTWYRRYASIMEADVTSFRKSLALPAFVAQKFGQHQTPNQWRS